MNKMIGLVATNYSLGDFGLLTEERPIASIPYGGRYRLIDFPISNIVNAGVTLVGVITPYLYRSILDHIGNGKPWNLSRKNEGLFVLPGTVYGYDTGKGKLMLRDIRGNKMFLERSNADYVVVACCNKIFNIDYYNPQDKQDLFLLNHYHYVIANMQERGIILSRNPGVAPHRYPIIYSGKTRVSWDTLRNLATYNNSASNIGVCWHAHAIGGYFGGMEDEELFIRYIQFGVFNPIFILAGEFGKYYKREPWKWDQIKLNVIREYMQLRNKLIPYIYNEGYIYHKYGVPIVQPLYYKYPKIYDEPNYVNQFFFGSKIMISPIIKRKNEEMNRVVQRIFIPSGTWYDYSSGKKFTGNKYYVNFYKESDYPIFVKEGSIIPMSLDMNTNIPTNMEVHIFPAENGLYGNYELYEDDGISKEVRNN